MDNIHVLENTFGVNNPKKPTKTYPHIHILKEKVESFLNNNLTLLGELPSLKSNPCVHNEQGTSIQNLDVEGIPSRHANII
jgi:hypothetical protein